MNAQEIFEIIQKNENVFNCFALRAMTPNPKTGKYPKAKVGGSIKSSYHWPDGQNTNVSCGGVCALQIGHDTLGEDKENIDAIETAIKDVVEHYVHDVKQVVLLGSTHAEYGNDDHEIIMSNGVEILAVWEV